MAHDDGEPSSCLVSPVRLPSPSFARRQCLLNYLYNVMVVLLGCRAVKFDSCNNLLSSAHTVLRGVQYVHCVMHKCIMVKVGGEQKSQKACTKHGNFTKSGGKFGKVGNEIFFEIGGMD